MTYEEYLEKYGKLVYRNVGTSMLPLLKQGRDLFIIEPVKGKRCKKYDVVLYRCPPGKYVLHRIVEVREKDYVILGDNCLKKEYGIKDEDILGVMTGFVRKEKQRNCKEPVYQVYSRMWVWTYPVRLVINQLRIFTRRFLGKKAWRV